MSMLRFILLFTLVAIWSCRRPQATIAAENKAIEVREAYVSSPDPVLKVGRWALLSTRYRSLEELKQIVQIQYAGDHTDSVHARTGKPGVSLTFSGDGSEANSVLKPGVTESDFRRAKDGHFWDRFRLILISPYTVMHRNDLLRVELLSRRRDHLFGEGDEAFYDLAETMVFNISADDVMIMSPEELSEKGYLNTFNHVVAQAFMTTLFSEALADFVGDVHERSHLPELITGDFTEEQLADLADGPVDNYIDIVNNECGQELGKILGMKYGINGKTFWTPELLANYLNDLLSYHSWVFQMGFTPFRATDDLVIRFSGKINRVLGDLSGLKKK